jgi:hypothetical protein
MKITAAGTGERKRWHKKRALMSVRSIGAGKTLHTVTDTATGEQVTLPAREAWDLHQRLNIEI